MDILMGHFHLSHWFFSPILHVTTASLLFQLKQLRKPLLYTKLVSPSSARGVHDTHGFFKWSFQVPSFI